MITALVTANWNILILARISLLLARYQDGFLHIEENMRYKKAELDGMRTVRLSMVPGWTWSARQAELKSLLSALRTVIRLEGHSRLPGYSKENSLPVGRWVEYVRSRHRKGILPNEIIEAVEAVKGWGWRRQQ